VLGGAVMVFDRLVAELARRAGYAQPRLSPLQRRLLLAEVIAGLELGELAESARSRGFVTAAGELISELSSALVEPERFAAAKPDRDIAAIYTAYRAALDRTGRVDDEVFAWRALDALRAAPRTWGPTPVLLYGFD